MDTIEFGHARRNINPHVPVSLAGYFNIRMWTGVLDDLFVQALALRQGKEAALLLQFDLVAVPNELIARIREGCADIAGLVPENVLFTASHTHTGPELRSRPGRSNPGYTDFAIAQAIELWPCSVAAWTSTTKGLFLHEIPDETLPWYLWICWAYFGKWEFNCDDYGAEC